jgi:hypothetical protein
MYHQLCPERSFANGRVARMSSLPVLINNEIVANLTYFGPVVDECFEMKRGPSENALRLNVLGNSLGENCGEMLPKALLVGSVSSQYRISSLAGSRWTKPRPPANHH